MWKITTFRLTSRMKFTTIFGTKSLQYNRSHTKTPQKSDNRLKTRMKINAKKERKKRRKFITQRPQSVDFLILKAPVFCTGMWDSTGGHPLEPGKRRKDLANSRNETHFLLLLCLNQQFSKPLTITAKWTEYSVQK